MHIVQLNLKAEKHAPVEEQAVLHVSAKDGIAGDIRSGGSKQISLWSSLDKAAADHMQPQGLCMGRFSSNVMLSSLQSGFRPGERLLLGDVEIEITQAGKDCYPHECPLPARGVRCPLQNCLYGRFITDGELRPGLLLTRLPSGE